MSKKKATTSISDKILDLMTPQAMQDPEIDSDDQTLAKTIDYFMEDEIADLTENVALSDIRKKNVKLLHDIDAKYRGKITSRKDFEDSDNEEAESGKLMNRMTYSCQ